MNDKTTGSPANPASNAKAAPAKAAAKAPAVATKPVQAKVKAAPATPAKKAVTPAPAKRPAVANAKAKAAPAPKAPKEKRAKLVRDSFSFPKSEYEVIGDLKALALKLGTPAKKSEILRAGIKVLAGLGEKEFLAAVKSVPNLKTGRPSK